MIEVRQTEVFVDWLRKLRDRRAAARIAERLRRLGLGHPGDAKPVGEGLSELRIGHGLSYRVYYVQKGAVVIILLCGGDKSSQNRDIARAKSLAREV